MVAAAGELAEKEFRREEKRDLQKGKSDESTKVVLVSFVILGFMCYRGGDIS